jgi:glutamate synthase (NADPH) large chain
VSAEQGLYRPAFERDSCGFGLIASLAGRESHWLVATAVSALARLTHRGAVAADGKTGDGCGILLSAPEAFLRAVAAEAGFTPGAHFAAGMVFLNPDPKLAAAARNTVRACVAAEGLQLDGWRTVPVEPDACGEQALKTLPLIQQVFVTAPEHMSTDAFRRRLFVARRRAEQKLEGADPVFYIASLSSDTLAYKAMVMPEQLPRFYPDLADERLAARICVFHQRFSTNTAPQWSLAQPFRYLAHNGEINTIAGNRAWAQARAEFVRPGLRPAAARGSGRLHGSDSQSLDEMFEILRLGGMDALKAMRILVIPPAAHSLDDTPTRTSRVLRVLRAAAPNPGTARPASSFLTVSTRPARSTATACARRAGRWVPTTATWWSPRKPACGCRPGGVLRKGRLGPGEMLADRFPSGELLESAAIDRINLARAPYKRWLQAGVRYLDAALIDPALAPSRSSPTSCSLPEALRTLARGARAGAPAAGGKRGRRHRLDGRRHPHAGAVAPRAAAVRPFPPGLRPGHQSADRLRSASRW